MFEVVVKLTDNWMDLSGVPETELFKAMSDWSSGRVETIRIKEFLFIAKEIVELRITR